MRRRNSHEAGDKDGGSGCAGAGGEALSAAGKSAGNSRKRDGDRGDAATLETELSALQRRKLRLAPEMDRCGEPLY